MKLVTYRDGDRETAGVLLGDEVLDLEEAAGPLGVGTPSRYSVLEIVDLDSPANAYARAVFAAASTADAATSDALRTQGALRSLSEATLLAPLRPGSILGHGLAYHSHMTDWNPDEPREKPERPPAGFLKSVTAVVGPDEAIRIPEIASEVVDWEGELSIVFGRECHNVSREEALSYVAGFTILNDVSARDWGLFFLKNPEARSEPAYASLNIMYKNFPTFAPLGPYVTTADEIADYRELQLVTRLNGQVMQDASLNDLIWDLPELIERYSAISKFLPGDVLSTGTPGGTGVGQKPPRFLRNGDVISVEVAGVGTLTNPVEGP